MSEEFNIFKTLKADRVVVTDDACKTEILDRLIDVLAGTAEVTDPDALTVAIAKREQMMSTGIGRGIGIPHVRIDGVSDIVMAVGLVRNGVPDYDSLDGLPVKLIFMIAARPDQHEEHLRLLSRISRSLKKDFFLNMLFSAPDAGALYQLLSEELVDE